MKPRGALAIHVLVLLATSCGDNETPCVADLAALPTTPCAGARCVDMFVVAHEDDDLLFASSELEGDVVAGHRVIVVYVTAGELGDPSSDQYWIDRERGLLNAYSSMLGAPAFDAYRAPPAIPDGWTFSTPAIAGVTVTEAALANVSLVFLRLGDLEGQCLWEQTNGCSLYNTRVAPPYIAFTKGSPGNGIAAAPALPSQDVSRDALIAVLAAVASQAQITSLGTLDATNLEFDALGKAVAIGPDAGYVEYWDHYFAGLFALTAAFVAQPSLDAPLEIALFRGYTVHREPVNLSDNDACAKTSAFARYAMFDAEVVPQPTPIALLATPDRYDSGDYELSSPTSWQRRSYAARTLPTGTSGRLAAAGACLGPSGPIDCDAAPSWTSTSADRLELDTECLTVEVTGGHIDQPAPMCGDAPCAPAPVIYAPESTALVPCDAATPLLVFDNGQIRTPNGRCLELDDTAVTSADCDRVIGADGHVTGVPIARQAWTVQ